MIEPSFNQTEVKMLKLEVIREMLKDRRPSLIAEATGISYPTVQSIRDGLNTNPTLRVLTALSDYLEGRQASEVR